jgi:chromosome segregation ATPase
MTNISDLQRRITTALDRIDRGIDRLPVGVPASTDLEKLRGALADEKAASAQLAERLRALKDRDGQTVQTLEARIEVLTRQLDVQGLEMQRLRKMTAQLRDQLRVLHEAAANNAPDPQLINKAMVVELESLRATRASETAELDEILSELTPLIREVAP